MPAHFVLCVDDEPTVLRTTKLVLEREGYMVSAAASVADALRLLNHRQFNLLLLNCIPNWAWLIVEAKRINPLVRVAICTGDLECQELPLADLILHKPVAPRLLLQSTAELLAA